MIDLAEVATIVETMPAFTPPNKKDVTAIVEERLAALPAGAGETVSIDWRGEKLTLNVIAMPVDLVVYNPKTHRVRAQRTLDPARDRDLDDAPFSPSAQAYLHQLLKGDPSDPSRTDPAFDKLKDDLSVHGQNDPGIITRDGVLINGNTRRAALKELGHEHVRVGVLPPDAGIDDVDALELSLQLRKDHRRDYSFMNLLLAIDERAAAGWTPKRIQREFRVAAKTVERNRWILDQIRELIARSTVHGESGKTAALRLVDFETHQGKLEELYGKYIGLKSSSPDEAEALKEQRLLAIALNHSKTDVRWIEADFTEKFGAELRGVIPPPSAPTLAPSAIPGTSIVAAAPSQRVEELKSLTTEVLRNKAIERTPEVVGETRRREATDALEQVEGALEAALNQAGMSGRIKKRRLGPVERLEDANDDLVLAREAVAAARSTGNFDPSDIDDALRKLRTSLRKLAQATHGEYERIDGGVRWLWEVAALTDAGVDD